MLHPNQRIEPIGRSLEALGGYMRISLDHLLCFPTTEPLQLVCRGARLPVPRRECVPEIVPAEILNSGPL